MLATSRGHRVAVPVVVHSVDEAVVAAAMEDEDLQLSYTRVGVLVEETKSAVTRASPCWCGVLAEGADAAPARCPP